MSLKSKLGLLLLLFVLGVMGFAMLYANAARPLGFLSGKMACMLAGLVSIGLAGLAWSIVQDIETPLTRFVDYARRVGDGEKDVAIDAAEAGEFGDAMRAINVLAQERGKEDSEKLELQGVLETYKQSAAGAKAETQEVVEAAAQVLKLSAKVAGDSTKTVEALNTSTASAARMAEAVTEAERYLATLAGAQGQKSAVDLEGFSANEAEVWASEFTSRSKELSDIILRLEEAAEQSEALAGNVAVQAAKGDCCKEALTRIAEEVKSMSREVQSGLQGARGLATEMEGKTLRTLMVTESNFKRIREFLGQDSPASPANEELEKSVTQSLAAAGEAASSIAKNTGSREVESSVKELNQGAEDLKRLTEKLSKRMESLT